MAGRSAAGRLPEIVVVGGQDLRRPRRTVVPNSAHLPAAQADADHAAARSTVALPVRAHG